MGKAIRTVSNPAKERAHSEGSRVLFVQPAYGEHGNVHAHYYRQWILFWEQSRHNFRELSELHGEVYSIEPEDSGFRALYSEQHNDLMQQYFASGTAWIISTWLTFQHFSNEALGHYYLHPANSPESIQRYRSKNNLDLQQKLKFILEDVLKTPELTKGKGYDAVIGKVEQMRNAINHPDKNNSYNASKNDWDTVPLAWLLSGQFKDRFKEIEEFANALFPAWEAKIKELERPGSLGITKRGVVSGRKPNRLRASL